MNDRSLDQLLNAWIDLGPTTAPDRVADAARLEVATTRQLPAILSRWAPRRFPLMNIYAKVALATAAVVVAALLGYNYLVAPNVGGPRLFGPEPTPVPTPSPIPVPTLEMGAGSLSAGSYRITDVDPFSITITVPTGWESLAVPAMVWSVEDEKAIVAYVTVDDLFADPCDPEQGNLGVGPSADDLAEALATYPGINVNSTTAVTISGFAGTRVDFTSTDVGCPGGDASLWTTQPAGTDSSHPGAGAGLQQFWILDVDGERLVIAVAAPVSAPPQRLEDVSSIVNSTVIEVP